MSSAWADFLAARLRLIHEWSEEGLSPEEITKELNHHDPGQVRLLIATPVRTEPATVYRELENLWRAADRACKDWEMVPSRSIRDIRESLKALRRELEMTK